MVFLWHLTGIFSTAECKAPKPAQWPVKAALPRWHHHLAFQTHLFGSGSFGFFPCKQDLMNAAEACESRIPLSYGKSECQFFLISSTEHRDI